MTAPPTDPPLPTFGERYEVLRQLGRGGAGSVWLARDREHAALRAIKVLEGTRPQSRLRFAREGRIMADLRHANVLAVHEVGEDGDRQWLVMDYAPGGSLADLLGRSRGLEPVIVCRLVAATLDGLQHAHDHGVVHRDVKPQNVLLAEDGTPLLADFGIAHLDEHALTATEATLGTFAYMAPEQRSTAREVDSRADVYGAGCLLYALLTAREPLDLYLAADWRGVPSALIPIVRRATAYQPDDRYPSASEMAAAVRAAAEDPNAEAAEVRAAPTYADLEPSTVQRRPRRVRWLAGSAVAVGAGLLAAGWWATRGPPAWVLAEVPAPDLALTSVGWSPSGELLYVAGGQLVARAATGATALGAFPDTTYEVGPDGAVYLTSWYEDLPLRRWTPDGTTDLPNGARHAHLSPDGAEVAWMNAGAIRVGPLGDAASRVVADLGEHQIVYDLHWSPDARWISAALGARDAAIELWPVDGGAVTRLPPDPRLLSPLQTIAVAWVGGELWWARADADGAVLEAVPIDATGRPGALREVARFPDGDFPVIVQPDREDERVAVVTAHRHRELFVGETAVAQVESARFSAGGELVTVGAGGLQVGVRVLDPALRRGRVLVAGDLALVVNAEHATEPVRVRIVPLAGGVARETTLPPASLLDCRGDRCLAAIAHGTTFALAPFDPRAGTAGDPILRVTTSRADLVELALSPSGSAATITDLGPDVQLVDLAGGTVRRLQTGLALTRTAAFDEGETALRVSGYANEAPAIADVPLVGPPAPPVPVDADVFVTEVRPGGQWVTLHIRSAARLWELAQR